MRLAYSSEVYSIIVMVGGMQAYMVLNGLRVLHLDVQAAESELSSILGIA